MSEISSSLSYQNKVSGLYSYQMEESNFETPTSIDRFVETTHRVYFSNVNHLDEAEIICIGETHTNDMHKKINAGIIDMLYVEGSILFEETSKGINQNILDEYKIEENDLKSEQTKYVTKPIKIEGWDIEINENGMKELVEFVRATRIYDKPSTIQYRFLSKSKITKWTNDLQNNQLSSCCRTKTIISFLCTLWCINIFIRSCRPCIRKYYKNKARKGLQKIINEVPVRNKEMCASIYKALKIHRKVFLIAGTNHLALVEEGEGVKGIDYRPANQAVEQTIKSLMKKKFAILIPKES